MRRISVIIITVICTSLVFAAKVWEKKEWNEWDQKEALKVLQSSPWVDNQMWNIGGKATVIATIAWRSSLPYRLAYARLLQLKKPDTSEEQLKQLIEGSASKEYYVVAVTLDVETARTDPRDLGNRALNVDLGVLLRDLQHSLESADVEFLKEKTYLLTKDGEKIPLQAYYPPSKVGGESALFVFPRTNADGTPRITLKDKEVRFMSELPSTPAAGITSLSRGFKLKNLVFKGQLEL